MPPNNVTVKGVIAGLNQKASLDQLQKDLNEIQDKLKLQVSNININNDIIGVLQKIADGLDKINSSAMSTNKEFTDIIKSVQTIQNGVRVTFNDGTFMDKLAQSAVNAKGEIVSVEQAINEFKASISQAFSGSEIQNVTGKYVNGQLAGLQASIKNGLDTQKVFGNAFGQITANNETEQIARTQEALQKANAMFEQYINVLDELSQRGIVSQQDLLKAEDLVWSQFASIAEGTTKSIAPVKQALNDLISTENAAIAQVEKGDAQLSALMDRIVGLKGNRTVNSGGINSLEGSALSLFDSGNLTAIRELEAEYAKYTEQMNMAQLQERANLENQQKDIQAQAQAYKEDLSNFQSSINEKIKIIKTLQQTQIISAQEAFNQLKTLYTQNVGDVRMSTDQELAIVKAMYQQEENMAKQSAEKQSSTMENSFQKMNHTGFGMGPLGMATTMVSFEASFAALENFRQGLVDVQQGSAGIQQVFANQISSQQQLNDVTNQFISIAQKYGTSITDVTNAAKLWGRQYKDVNEALVLTNNSTLLSIVDNLHVSDANRAVESSMNAMQMSVNNVGEAYANSMKLVDSWSAVSHEASVSAQDLTQGFERSAAAARVAGLSIDQLNSLIAASVRNTGRSGATMGNMWKSVLSNIDSMTPKVQDAFKQLGISLTQVGANGQKEMKPMWDILNELAQVTEHANSSQVEYLKTIAGGKFQYDSMVAALSNTRTLTQAYQDSLTSQGKAAELAAAQMNTVHAQLQRLADDIQKFAYNAGNGGLTVIFTDLVKGAADLFEGLQKVNPVVLITVAGLLGVVPVTNSIVKSFKSMSDGVSNFLNILNGARSRTIAYFTETAAQSASSSATTVASTLAENAAKSKLVQTEKELMLTTKSGLLVKASDVEAMDAQTVATLGLDEAEVTAGDTTKGLISLFGILDISSGGLLGILGLVASGVAAYAIASGSSANATNQQTQSVNELTQAYDQNKSQVDSLLSTYTQLEKATNNGTVFRDSQQEQQYYDVMSKLANLLPNVTTYVDANGRAHIKTAQAIQDEIKAQQQLIQDQAKATADNFAASYQKQLDSINKTTNQIRVLKNEMDIVNKTHIIDGISTQTPQGQKLVQQLQQQIDALPVSIDNANQSLQKLFSDTINASIKAQGTVLSDSNQGLLNSIIGSVDWGKIQNDQQKIQDVMSQIEKSVTSVAQSGTSSYTELDGTLQSLNKSGLLVNGSLNTLEKSFQQTSQTVANSTQDLQDWTAKAANVIQQNKLLDQAESDLNKTGKLSSGVLSDLIAKYPDLTNVVGQGSQAILDWIKNEKDSSAQTLIAEEQKTQAVINQTEQRIAEINREIAAEQQLLAATQAMSSALMDQSAAFAAAGDMTNAMKAAQLANMPQTNVNNDKAYRDYLQNIVDNANSKMKTLRTAIGAIQGIGAGIAGTGVPGSGRIRSPKSSSSGTVNPLTDFLDNHQDPFTDQIAKQDAALKESQSVMALYDSTSQQYRAELQKQIEILKEKQNSVKGEINWTNQNISALEKLAASEGKTSQRDATIKEIDKEKTSVITLTGTYYDLQKQINDTNNTLTKDSQQAFFDKLDASVKQTTTTIDNLKTALDLMQNSGSGDSQQQLEVMNQLSDAYAQNLVQINNNIAALQQEASTLNQNTAAWQQNQTELQKWQSQQVLIAQSMKSLEGQYMSDAINVMNQMKQEETDALTAREQNMQDTIKNLQDQGKQFDMSDWNSNLEDVSNTLDEIDSKFDASPFVDTTGTVRNNLSSYNSILQQIANTVNSMTSSSSSDENGLFGQIQNEISYANQLKQQLADVNEQIKQNTLTYKQQEDQLNEQIKTETQNYDDQIKALQQKSSILDQQFNQEDRLQQLEDEQTKLDQALQDKRFSFIDSQGNEVFKADQTTVNQIKQEQDKLLEQFQRQDIKDSIQAQIDALNSAKDRTTTTLQTQLDNMKNIHQEELQSQQDYASTLSGLLQGLNSDVQTKSQQLSQLFSDQKTAVDQSWTDMENAVRNGTLDISSVMSPNSPWYQNTIGTLKQLNVDVQSQISQLLSEFAQIQNLNMQIAGIQAGLIPGMPPPPVSGGTQYVATSSMPNNVTRNSDGTYSFVGMSGQKNTVTQQQALQYGWIAPSGSSGGGGGGSSGGSNYSGASPSSSNSNSSSGSGTNMSGASDAQKEKVMTDAINGGGGFSTENGHTTIFDRNGKTIATYHEGGIVGTIGSPMTDLVNKLFNTRPNEQIIKALVGEVMVPHDNIVKNFVPNMQALVGSVANAYQMSQPSQITYDLHDFTVQSNDPTDFLNQINHLVVSERR